jgi:hypothetical protein
MLSGKRGASKAPGAIASPHSFRDLALPFLRLGLTPFGSPAAHIVMILFYASCDAFHSLGVVAHEEVRPTRFSGRVTARS